MSSLLRVQYVTFEIVGSIELHAKLTPRVTNTVMKFSCLGQQCAALVISYMAT